MTCEIRGRRLRRRCGMLRVALGCLLALGVVGTERGAVMASEAVTVRRLGDARPRMASVGTSGRDFVDPSPIVLWAGARPAAVLHLEVETRGRKATQRIGPVDPAAKLPGFPFTYTIELPEDARSEEDLEGIDAAAVVPADVDGDGVDELVLVRMHGGVDVLSTRGPVAQFASPAPTASGATYKRRAVHVARLGGRDVVFVLSVCAAPDVDDRNLLLRVDGHAVTRVRLAGLEKATVHALGALQRPASHDVDELLVVTADGERDAALARYRPDGKPIAPPRRMYVRPPEESTFLFVPRSASAVLEVPGGVLVLAPEKPANWIREIRVQPKADPRTVEIHAVVELDRDPKVVHGVGDALWAVDHDGTCFAPAPGGRWTPLPKPGPYLRLPVPPGDALWFVWQSEAGPLLAVSSREQGIRATSHDDWRRAADRWLPPPQAGELRQLLEPSLARPHGYRDVRMKRERARRGVDAAAIRSVDDWKRLLPDSFAEVQAYDARTYDVEVAARFRALREDPRALAALPDPAGARAFLDDLEVQARTTFMVVEGTSVSTVSIAGSPMRRLETQVARPVEYRLRDGRLAAVLTLAATDAAGKAEPAFHLVEAALAARR